MDENCFHRFLDELPLEVFRMKGIVRFRDRAVFVSRVGHKCYISQRNGLPDETCLAFVVWGDDHRSAIIDKFRKCLRELDSTESLFPPYSSNTG